MIGRSSPSGYRSNRQPSDSTPKKFATALARPGLALPETIRRSVIGHAFPSVSPCPWLDRTTATHSSSAFHHCEGDEAGDLTGQPGKVAGFDNSVDVLVGLGVFLSETSPRAAADQDTALFEVSA